MRAIPRASTRAAAFGPKARLVEASEASVGGVVPAACLAQPAMPSASRSANAVVDRLVLARGMVGIIEASAT